MSVYVEQNGTIVSFSDFNSWIILSPVERSIKSKIEALGTPLKNWNLSINYGIKTGCNDAFIINDTKKDELIAADPKSAEIIRPILRGRDIKRYGYDFADLWLINSHNGIKSKNIPPININDYPAIKAHLDNFYDKLIKRTDKGDTPYNLRNCIYTDDFFKHKIIYPNMTKFLPFYYDDCGFMTNQKCFIITGENIAYLIAFLNSSIFKLCFRDNFPELLGGTRELSKIFFEKIPVKQITNTVNESFKILVKSIQQKKSKNIDTTYEEQKIEEMLWDIYNLTDIEREICKSFMF